MFEDSQHAWLEIVRRPNIHQRIEEQVHARIRAMRDEESNLRVTINNTGTDIWTITSHVKYSVEVYNELINRNIVASLEFFLRWLRE